MWLYFFVLLNFRSLRCVRNKVHTHLFISLILNNVCWIFWYAFLLYDWKYYFETGGDWSVRYDDWTILIYHYQIIYLRIITRIFKCIHDIILGYRCGWLQDTSFFYSFLHGHNIHVDVMWRYITCKLYKTYIKRQKKK